jgi:hypothetical protein
LTIIIEGAGIVDEYCGQRFQRISEGLSFVGIGLL